MPVLGNVLPSPAPPPRSARASVAPLRGPGAGPGGLPIPSDPAGAAHVRRLPAVVTLRGRPHVHKYLAIVAAHVEA